MTETVSLGLLDPSLRLKAARSAVVTVQVVPAPLERTLRNRPVHLRNLGATLEAQAVPAAVELTLRGSRDALNRVDADDIVAYRRPRRARARRVLADGARRLLAGRRGSRASSPRPCRCESPVANSDTTGSPKASDPTARRPSCSAPTACAARRADTRSIRRRCAGSARRSCARTRPRRRPGDCRAIPGRPRHARIRRVDRGGARARRLGRGRDGDERRRRADAGRGLPDAHARVRRRRGDLGVAQSVRGQRHQGVLRQGREVHRARRAGGRGDRRRHVVDARRDGEPAHVPHADLVGAYLDHLRAVLPGVRRRSAGFKLAIDCANGATTTVAPPLFSSLGLDIDGHRRSAGRPQHQPGMRVDASRAARAHGRRARLPDGRGVRRRRRPRDLRRSPRARSSTATPCC